MQVYIIAGPNGSGKSTFAEEFIQGRELAFVNADIIARELSPNVLDKKVMVRAGRVFFLQLHGLLDHKVAFVVETTLSGRYMAKVIERLKREGHKVKMVYILVETPCLSIERVKVRVLNGGHHVPDPDIIRRYARSKANFWNIYRMLVDSWEIYDNSGKRFRPVAIGRGTTYVIFDHEIFDTFRSNT